MKRPADMTASEIEVEVASLRLLWNAYAPPVDPETDLSWWVIDRVRDLQAEEARRGIVA